jgi:hypothetical protein
MKPGFQERGTNVGQTARTPGKRGSRADQRARRVNNSASRALSAKPPSLLQILIAVIGGQGPVAVAAPGGADRAPRL